MISLLQSLVFSTVALAPHKHSAWCCTSLWDLLPAPAGALSGILKGEAIECIQGHVWVNAQEHLGVEAEAQGQCCWTAGLVGSAHTVVKRAVVGFTLLCTEADSLLPGKNNL